MTQAAIQAEQQAVAGNACLMVAFHYPPCRTSSGYLRSQKFVRYLPEFGWQPQVLTARAAAYGDGSQESGPCENVQRAYAFDARARFSFRGKYPEFLTLPDRWWSWMPGALWRGWRLFRQSGYRVVWSTYPTPTALLVGYGLKLLTGRPWVADLRDPMVDEVHPDGRLKRRVFRGIEALAVKRADALVVTTDAARDLYLRRYAGLPESRIHCIGNGFDEADFAGLDSGLQAERPGQHKLRLVHSGTLYPLERNPVPFLNALARLRREGSLQDCPFEVVLRASGHDDWLQGLIRERDLADWVRLAPAIDYREALREMLESDGLLLFQAANCPAQIPAKLYEYLRSGTPVFALTDAAGATAALLRECDWPFLVDLEDEQAIARAWLEFVRQLRTGDMPGPDQRRVAGLSRRQASRRLATLFDQLAERTHA